MFHRTVIGVGAVAAVAFIVGCGNSNCEQTLTCEPAPGGGGLGGGGGAGSGGHGGSGGSDGGGGMGGTGGEGGEEPQPLVVADVAIGMNAAPNANTGTLCVVAGGDIWCRDTGMPALLLEGLPMMAQVELGIEHGCGRSADKKVYCWGANDWGQLGIHSYEPSAAPVQVSDIPAAEEIHLGVHHSCARNNGAVWCWGIDISGQVGDGGGQGYDVNAPSLVVGVGDAARLSKGRSHTSCVARSNSNGSMSCWGDNKFGAASGSTEDFFTEATPISGFNFVQQVANGIYTTCVIADSKLFCIGSDQFGVIGNNGNDAEQAIELTAVGAVQDVAVGYHHACAVLADGTASCWGTNDKGQFGNGAISGTPTPVPSAVPGLSNLVQIEATRHGTCARTSVGQLYCWGETPLGIKLMPERIDFYAR